MIKENGIAECVSSDHKALKPGKVFEYSKISDDTGVYIAVYYKKHYYLEAELDYFASHFKVLATDRELLKAFDTETGYKATGDFILWRGDNFEQDKYIERVKREYEATLSPVDIEKLLTAILAVRNNSGGMEDLRNARATLYLKSSR